MKLMIDILEEMLPFGLKIEHYKEHSTKYTITLVYKASFGTMATVELPKMVIPGTEKEMCGYAICTAMSTIMINQNNLIEAKEWMDMIVSGEYKTLGVRPISWSVCKLQQKYINSQSCYQYQTLYEFIETYEEADLLAQYEMKRKCGNDLIFIFPGANRNLSDEEREQVKELAKKYKVEK